MNHYQDNDLARVKDLLQHTGEFIAYFELAESKMMEWRDEIEQQTHLLNQQAQLLQQELKSIHGLISQAGIAEFRLTTEKALSQGSSNLQNLEQHCTQFKHALAHQQEQLQQLTTQCIDKIEKHAAQTTQSLVAQWSKYDVQKFHRIASESCDHVERVANDAVIKSNKLLSMVQLRFGLFTMLATALTSFIIVLYLCDELPWEMHHQAMNEREAGKVLLQAWSGLTAEEKTKILKNDRRSHG